MSAFDCAHVDVEDFLECLEIRNVSKATAYEYRFSCPFPGHTNGDENASAYMNEETTAWFCHGCKEKGNAIYFAAQLLEISPLEAIRMLKQRYQPGGINPDSVSVVEEVQKILSPPERADQAQPKLPDDATDRFATDWHAVEQARERGEEIDPIFTYMLDRGFGPEVLEEWEFGYDPISHRIAFAVRDVDGTLIGFKGRAHDDRQPKYLVLGDKPDRIPRYGWPCYFTSRVVFGANRISPGSELVVCEGELNAIAVTSRTGRPAVAINGSWFTDSHARVIRALADRVILFLDDDKAGKEAVWGWIDSKGRYQPGIVERLKNFVPVYLVPRTEKDAAEMDGSEIEDLLGKSESALLRSLAVC